LEQLLFTFFLSNRKSTSSSETKSLLQQMPGARFPSGSQSRLLQQQQTTIKLQIQDGPNLRVVSRLQTFQNQSTPLAVTITRTKSRHCCCVTKNAADLKNSTSRQQTIATVTSKLIRKLRSVITSHYITLFNALQKENYLLSND
jgi:hypothetical protein